MMRFLTGSTARNTALACALAAPIAFGSAAPAGAQQPEAPVGTAPVEGTPLPSAPPPTGLSESVAAVVNDDIISTYDLAQRMRLLIATSGIQPTQENLPQFQREALVGLVDERLQFQELRRVEKEQKIEILADDEEVDEEISAMAQQSNMSRDQLLSYLATRG